MTTQQQKAVTNNKKTTKKRQLSKLPATLPNYNYESFSYKDIQKAATYYQNELAKIEKLIGKVTQISKPNESSIKHNSTSDFYNAAFIQPTNNTTYVDLPPSPPKISSVSTKIQPSIPGVSLDMPTVGGGITPKAEVHETLQQPAIIDNSVELESVLKNMLSQNAV